MKRLQAHIFRPDGSLYGTGELTISADGATFAEVPVCAEPLKGALREVTAAVGRMDVAHEVRTARGYTVRRVRNA